MPTILLLFVSNAFMTIAWYWHLKGGMQKPLAACLLVLGAISGCGESQPDQAAGPSRQPPNQVAKSSQASAAVEPTSNEQGEPPAAEDGKRPEAAADVARLYYALISDHKYQEAWQLRWDGGTAGLTDFIAGFDDYADYHAVVGNPSEVQGAAGSLYVEVPVQLYGKRKNGSPFGSAGTVTLRRVNDVPGSTAKERSWRIYAGD